MSVYAIDPIADPRWAHFIEKHPHSSVFHSVRWLEALRRTYGYRPLVLTTTRAGDDLTDGLALCNVKSWIGTRLVSLPFSDHCDPLIDRADKRHEIVSFLKRGVDAGTWKYVELRPRRSNLEEDATAGRTRSSQRYCLHAVDLTQSLEGLHQRFHRSCVQRAIRRAEREPLEYEAGSSPRQIAAFYQLLRLTRRRHGMPPQPLAWFENLAACLGDRLTIRMASKTGRPIAAILTLSFRKTMVYKYGCSDAAYHKLGAMPFLFWRAIQDAKAQDLEELDLGRSDLDQPGLMVFKDRFGASRSTLTYYRQSSTGLGPAADGWKQRVAGWLFQRLPDPALTLAGRVLYKHLG